MQPQDLNNITYFNNIRFKNLFFVRYKGLRISVTRSAMTDMIKLGIDLTDIKRALEDGYFSPRKRKKGVIEKWIYYGRKTLEVVVIKDFHELLHQEEWLLIHCSIFTKKK